MLHCNPEVDQQKLQAEQFWKHRLQAPPRRQKVWKIASTPILHQATQLNDLPCTNLHPTARRSICVPRVFNETQVGNLDSLGCSTLVGIERDQIVEAGFTCSSQIRCIKRVYLHLDTGRRIPHTFSSRQVGIHMLLRPGLDNFYPFPPATQHCEVFKQHILQFVSGHCTDGEKSPKVDFLQGLAHGPACTWYKTCQFAVARNARRPSLTGHNKTGSSKPAGARTRDRPTLAHCRKICLIVSYLSAIIKSSQLPQILSHNTSYPQIIEFFPFLFIPTGSHLDFHWGVVEKDAPINMRLSQRQGYYPTIAATQYLLHHFNFHTVQRYSQIIPNSANNRLQKPTAFPQTSFCQTPRRMRTLSLATSGKNFGAIWGGINNCFLSDVSVK